MILLIKYKISHTKYYYKINQYVIFRKNNFKELNL